VRARARHLLKEQGRVIGVVVETDGQQQEVRAKHGVVVACGGFDWNADLMRRLLPVPIEETQTPPVNRGDAIQLAEEVGAQLRHLDEAWWLPGKRVPGRPLYEDQEIAMWLTGDRIWPHSLWVNARGQRFCNEAAQNTGNELVELDARGAPLNMPCYCILDAQFRRRYPILGSIKPAAADPDWLIHAPSLEALAQELSIPADELARTVERFNQLARSGRDTDFGRGDGAYERFFGDESAGHPTLGTVAEPPFYAYPIRTSAVGTKGGIMTNRYAQALDANDAPIAGLYAAGNAAAAFNGPLTVAAGCTITPALVMGRVAALHALGRRSSIAPGYADNQSNR
jgi:succinate dehydrogenase/fumarate reductase flavoprotein subunit